MVGKMEIGGVGNWGKQISRGLALHAGSAGYVVWLVGSTWENETSPSSGKEIFAILTTKATDFSKMTTIHWASLK
jgi:hypothetical protein